MNYEEGAGSKNGAEPYCCPWRCLRCRYTPEKIGFVRVEAGTNLIGGQPFSLQNLKDVRAVRAGAPCTHTAACLPA